ncbi:MAG: copper amine oxidase N-terminal domain-containing protein [Peptostreptococcaceae bacterium]|nr:copper amine oxidase N-terminal domain-containing protein [Peptostreptococcaceae bacterium]
MKKRLVSLLCAGLLALTAIPAFADGEKEYMVPVKMVQAHEKTKESMANKGLKPEAKVVVDDKESQFTIYLQPVQIGAAKENINKLFVMDGDKKVEASKSSSDTTPYDTKVEFKVNAVKPNEVTIAVWVDAMDKIAGGKEGAGEQKAVLVFDWSKATEVKAEKPAMDDKKDDKKDDKMTEKPMVKSGIEVYVAGEMVKFDSQPVSKNGRVLVPLRAIFEALKAEVKWDANTQTVTAMKDGKTVTLVMNKAEAKVMDGTNSSTIKLEVPASMQNGRTYVPLRFIGEAFGNKVDFEKQANGSLITIS